MTTAATASVRIAIGQLPMRWSGDDNAAALVDTLAFAAAEGVDVCVFPELAVPGFHRRIVDQAKADLVDGWVRAIGEACAAHRVAATFGAPTFAPDGRLHNSQLFVDADGRCLSVVEKRGLTAPEATFFAAGSARPVVAWRGLGCTSVICREVEDHDEVSEQLRDGGADLVFWPGLMGAEPGGEPLDPPRHVQQAQRLAKTLGAFVVQANWPNSLNHPEQSVHTGASAVIDRTGTLQFRLPKAEPGIGVFVLGEPSYTWHPRAGAPAA